MHAMMLAGRARPSRWALALCVACAASQLTPETRLETVGARPWDRTAGTAAIEPDTSVHASSAIEPRLATTELRLETVAARLWDGTADTATIGHDTAAIEAAAAAIEPDTSVHNTAIGPHTTTHATAERRLETVEARPWDGAAAINAPGERECKWKKVANLPRMGRDEAAPSGYKHCLRPYDELMSNQIFKTGTWPDCRNLPSLWKHAKPRGENDVLVDAGAGIGACALYVAAYGIPVVAFEPNPANLHYLTRSLMANAQLKRLVTLYPFALGDARGVLPLFTDKTNAGNSVLKVPIHTETQAAHHVPVVPLDAVLSDTSPHVRVMKMDVQGFEVNLLRGARRVLRTHLVSCFSFELKQDWLKGQSTSVNELGGFLARSGYRLMDLEEYTTVTTQRMSVAASSTVHRGSEAAAFAACDPKMEVSSGD